LAGFDEVILATGIVPRVPDIPGIDHPKVASYAAVVEGRAAVGRRAAIIGAGGIGFDVAEFLTHRGEGDVTAFDERAIDAFCAEWGIDRDVRERGGITQPHAGGTLREVWLLQRKEAKVGAGLAKTTGWIRRTLLKQRGVHMLGGVEYQSIDDAGLHVKIGDDAQVLTVDTIVICAGQLPRRELVDDVRALGLNPTLIGGADVALELDAKRAIDQGTRVALAL